MTVNVKFTTKKHKSVLPKDMRALPEEDVARDADEADKIHVNDPAHVRRALLKDRYRKAVARMTPGQMMKVVVLAWCNGIRRNPQRMHTVNQFLVDAWRFPTIIRKLDKKLDFTIQHIWFEKTASGAIGAQLRTGPAPRDAERPPELRGLQLEVDLLDWPERMRDIVKAAGVDVGPILAELQNAKKDQDFEAAVRRCAG